MAVKSRFHRNPKNLPDVMTRVGWVGIIPGASAILKIANRENSGNSTGIPKISKSAWHDVIDAKLRICKIAHGLISKKKDGRLYGEAR